MNATGKLIDTLSHSEVYREYERAYSPATGMPIVLRPVESWQLPFHGKQKENPWCAMMAEKNPTCAGCLRAQSSLTKSAMNHASTVTCIFGLTEAAVPVKLGRETIGFLQTGQVMTSKPSDAEFDRTYAVAEKLGVRLDPERAHEAYFSTPVVSEKKMESVTNLLGIFAEHLSIKSNQILVQTTNAEPAVINKARQYIEEHHTEDLDLGQVAAAVHSSIFYFCKLFKKVTGLNFTEYLARLRTEKAKNLLLNPNLRVSEVAYEVGFQSLTHFNRVFKKVTGQAPRTYRNSLKSA